MVHSEEATFVLVQTINEQMIATPMSLDNLVQTPAVNKRSHIAFYTNFSVLSRMYRKERKSAWPDEKRNTTSSIST